MSQERWGSEAVEFFEAHAEAICSQDHYDVVRFYDAEVVADYRALVLGQFPGQLRVGRHEMVSFLDLCLFAPTSQVHVEVVDVFLHPGGAVTIERWTDPNSSQVTMVAALVEVGSNGIELIRYFLPAEGLAGGGDDVTTTEAVRDRLRELAERRWPDQPWSGIEIFGFTDDDDQLAHVVLVLDDGSAACPVPTAWWWAIDGETVMDERRHTRVQTDDCHDPDEQPEGWWNGQSLPVPLEERQTATVLTAGQTIELYNSDADRENLVVWSFARFEVLGLDAPEVHKIIFEPSRACGDYSGIAHLGTNGSTLYHCVHDIGCTAPSCDRFTNVAKLSMLHELAHPWLEANVDPQQRQAFLDLTGISDWHDRSIPWDDRGVEWAAEILAWGLLDTPMGLLRLGFPTCELRVQAFGLLTSRVPPTRCDTTTS